jgi:hypothetical protein
MAARNEMFTFLFKIFQQQYYFGHHLKDFGKTPNYNSWRLRDSIVAGGGG